MNLVNFFDTQLANAFLGGTYTVSYQQIVDDNIGVKLDKKETRTNWLRRPLSDSQLHYAASDVQFLLDLYNQQTKELNGTNKIHWFEEEQNYISTKLVPVSINHTSCPLKITRAAEKKFLNEFNEIVLSISKREKINQTLLFSRKYQKDFLKMILVFGLDKAFNQITSWRKNLIYEAIFKLFKDIKV